jgi:UDP-2-acetamido-3-amino-2,3-dideoxy-glucuronate N-acetyltransferase
VHDPADVFIHPQALVESESIGPGTRIWAFAHVMYGAVVGRNCNICDHSFVESTVKIGDAVTVKNGVALWDLVTIEDRVFIGPYAVFTNDRRPRVEVKKGREQLTATLVKEGATVGANATIVAGVTIGRYAMVGAGTVVLRDVPEQALVVGNPGRLAGYVCICGEALNADFKCVCGREFAHLGKAAL